MLPLFDDLPFAFGWDLVEELADEEEAAEEEEIVAIGGAGSRAAGVVMAADCCRQKEGDLRKFADEFDGNLEVEFFVELGVEFGNFVVVLLGIWPLALWGNDWARVWDGP